ncbi:MAG: class I SAM-dependent methyltransferase [Ruminiclostridium sp.]|nr:class I SAM-dependent methyltransferase [Ruminiclostridium sp.]
MKKHKHISYYDITNILCKLENNKSFMEMTERDLRFLCGLLRDKMPKKVVEIGVAAGFTTNVILTCLHDLKCNCDMYSVDYSKYYYRDMTKETGFLTQSIPDNIKYRKYFGNIIAEFIDDICSDNKKIDFLIIDTTHSVPGEIIDFIVCLPYLADECIVVLHDVGLNHLSNGMPYQYATRLLFDSATGVKYFEDNTTDEIDNIAAIKITNDTFDNIVDVFSCLSITWQYMLSNTDIDNYGRIIKRHYSDYFYSMYIKITSIQKKTFSIDFARKFFKSDFNLIYSKWNQSEDVVVYGFGYYGKEVIGFAQINNLPISAIVISDDQTLPENGEFNEIPIYHISDLNDKYESVSVIMGVGDEYRKICLHNLDLLKIEYKLLA